MIADVRSTCGRARIAHRPTISTVRPWLTFVDGTAGAQHETCHRALVSLVAKGFTFPIEEV